ncbi:MAG: hypothetical protein M3451_08065 [Chloroflexota bacterium]|nr:hypothetical protein [Chloroflexota bacterium]
MAFWWFFALVVFVNRPAADEALARSIAAQPATLPDALRDADVAGDRACVFGPYSTDDAIAEELGFRWEGASQATGIGSSDAHELVVGADDTEVVAWTLVPRPTGSDLLQGNHGCQPID